jgi:hypothetical protein
MIHHDEKNRIPADEAAAARILCFVAERIEGRYTDLLYDDTGCI